MTFRIPKVLFGKVVDGSLERLLKNTKGDKENKSPRKPKAQIVSQDIDNPENWILLEGRQHDTYQYGNLFVCMHSLGYDANVEKAARDLGLNVANTAKEKDGTDYIGSINWEDALKLNLALGNTTLTPRQGMDLMYDLRQGFVGRKKIYDAKGKELDKKIVRKMFDEIWGVREPWRAEWLDARFVEDGGMKMLYGHELDVNSNLNPQYNEPLEDCLTEDNLVNVRSANRQGMFTKSSDKGDFYFYYPRDGAVARFDAFSDGALLCCDRNPSDRITSLGVRAVRAKN